MTRTTFIGVLSLALASTVLCGTPAQAQATRTWVSGVGDDANPCSRTAPCKTFAGAISKTAVGGEIDALDPGGFGALTITKSITLDGGGGIVASILVAGTNGIVISGANIAVTLRNLSLQGVINSGNGGTNGINILNAARVQVEHCEVNGFNISGINFAPSAAGAKLTITDTVIHDNATGIIMAPLASGIPGMVALDRTTVSHNTTGLSVGNNTKAIASNSAISNNTGDGAKMNTTSALAVLEFNSSSISGNSGNGFTLTETGGHPIVKLTNSSIYANVGSSMSIGFGTDVFSFGNNAISDNGVDTLPNGSSQLH